MFRSHACDSPPDPVAWRKGQALHRCTWGGSTEKKKLMHKYGSLIELWQGPNLPPCGSQGFKPDHCHDSKILTSVDHSRILKLHGILSFLVQLVHHSSRLCTKKATFAHLRSGLGYNIYLGPNKIPGIFWFKAGHFVATVMIRFCWIPFSRGTAF